jgi:cyclopropane-fatty-acyl-phospholipid synthase
MTTQREETLIQELFNLAGITVNGNNPWDIQVNNFNFYQKLFTEPYLGLGETYMDGWWDCPHSDQFFYRLLRVNIEDHIQKNRHFLFSILQHRLKTWLRRIFNYQSKEKSFDNGRHHYDIGNSLFEEMLDKRLIYSCGYWKNAHTLDEAQEAKLDLICRKLNLQPGMRILDIGCGWGGFAKYAAEKFQVSVVGITISQQQYDLARERVSGLPIEIRLTDYRELNEKFDRICSIGMFEHVGHQNYSAYMQTVRRCLDDEGLFLLHTIGNNYSTVWPNEWINKYIFPNGNLPSLQQISQSIEKVFVLEDLHNFGADYDKTLMAWHHNFNQHYDRLKSSYDERFHRMWNYYLLSCAGAFRARDIQLWQIVLSKNGIVGGYQSVR